MVSRDLERFLSGRFTAIINNVVGLPVAAIWQRISQDENMKKFIKVDKE